MAAFSDKQSHYEILHVSPGAPEEIIRASYRTLMQRLKHHPDLGGDAAVAALINEAYAVLTDPVRRAAYDQQLAASRTQDETPQEPPAEPFSAAVDPAIGCAFCSTPHELGTVIAIEDACGVCESPLYAAEKRRLEEAGQRAVQRIQKRQVIRFFTRWPQHRGFRGRTEDVSLQGLRFTTRRDLSVGQRIKIVSNVMDAVATVTHCSRVDSGWRIRNVAGVAFVTLRFAKSVGGFVSERV